MFNEKYIFWETEIILNMSGGIKIYTSYSEWLDMNAQINTGFAINSKEPLSEENITALSSHDVRIKFHGISEDRRYMPGTYFHNPDKSFFESVWELGQYVAELLGQQYAYKKDYYHCEPEIIRKPHVWHQEKNGEIKLLTREEFDNGKLEEKDEFYFPVLLLAVLRNHRTTLPKDLFVSDRTEFSSEDLEQKRIKESRPSILLPIDVVLRRGELTEEN